MTIIIKPKTDPNSGLDIDLLINPISRMRSSDAICPPKINLANRYDLPDHYKIRKRYTSYLSFPASFFTNSTFPFVTKPGPELIELPGRVPFL